MIACPKCGSPTGVRETREENGYVRRRRVCQNVACAGRVTTFEIVVADPRSVPDPVIVSRRAVAAVARVLEPPKTDDES